MQMLLIVLRRKRSKSLHHGFLHLLYVLQRIVLTLEASHTLHVAPLAPPVPAAPPMSLDEKIENSRKHVAELTEALAKEQQVLKKLESTLSPSNLLQRCTIWGNC